MAVRSRFAPVVPPAPAGRKLSSLIVKDMQGLNSTDPYGVLPQEASPYLRNARMYLAETQRQVAISTRRGERFYTVPIGEASVAKEDSATGQDEVVFAEGQLVAQQFSPDDDCRLTKLEVSIRRLSGAGTVLVQVYSDDSGEPADLIATTSLAANEITENAATVTTRFIEAPALLASDDYWLVFSCEGGEYGLQTTTNSTDALVSATAGVSWTAQSFSVNYDAFGSDEGGVKGLFRYNSSTGVKETYFAHGEDIYKVNDVDGTTTSVKDDLAVGATHYRFAKVLDDIYVVNGQDGLLKYDGTTFEPVDGAPSTPELIAYHKGRIFTKPVNEGNRIDYSNYFAMEEDVWDSTNFDYFDSPEKEDPITAMIPFQDRLIVFTTNDKYEWAGENVVADGVIRQSIGKRGAVSQEAVVTDDNYIYYVSNDGHLYRWNGSRDEQISRVIEADLDDIASIRDVRLTLYKDRILVWFQQSGQIAYNRNFVYETRYNQWFYDTDRYTNMGVVYTNENNELVQASSEVGALYYGDQTYSDLGKPIDFEYHTNYFDFGMPDNLKQVRRLYLQFRRTDWVGKITVATDKDFANDPTEQEINTSTGATTYGSGNIYGDGLIYASGEQYFRHRMTVPGQGTHYQVRVRKSGVETPVFFMGYSQYFRFRRAA
jgi:hypothetical protein